MPGIARGTRERLYAQFELGLKGVWTRQLPDAAAAFAEAERGLNEAPVPDATRTELRHQIHLNLARVSFLRGNYADAYVTYGEVPRNSAGGYAAAQERIWADYLQNNFRAAADAAEQLESLPAHPETDVEDRSGVALVRTLALMAMRRPDEAARVNDQALQRCPSVLREIDAFTSSESTRSDEGIVHAMDAQAANRGGPVFALMRPLWNQPRMVEYRRYLASLDAELRTIQQAPAPWQHSSAGARALQDVSVEKAFALENYGGALRSEVSLLRARFEELLTVANELRRELGAGPHPTARGASARHREIAQGFALQTIMQDTSHFDPESLP